MGSTTHPKYIVLPKRHPRPEAHNPPHNETAERNLLLREAAHAAGACGYGLKDNLLEVKHLLNKQGVRDETT